MLEIRNTAQGIRNPTKDWNLESKSKDWNQVSGIQNLRLSWIPSMGASIPLALIK